MKPYAQSLARAGRSGIRAMFDLAATIPDVISLAVGEPAATASPAVVQAGQQALASNGMRYTPIEGIAPLRQAIADYSRAHKGLDYDPKREVMATHGATAGIDLSLRVLVDPGDEVIMGSPYFTAYPSLTALVGGVARVVRLRASDGFEFRAADIEAAVTDRTKAIILNSPNNPTGAVTPPAELERIADVALRHDLWVISDEVYHRSIYDGAQFASIAAFPGMKERTVVLDSLSKTYAMTGWRVGYMLAPNELIEHAAATGEVVTSSLNPASQYGAIAALTGPQDGIAAMNAGYVRNREAVIAAVAQTHALRLDPPHGAFYAFVDVRPTGLDAHELALRLLRERHVAVVPGDAFGPGGVGFVRISYVGDPALIREAMARLVDFAEAVASESGSASVAVPASVGTGAQAPAEVAATTGAGTEAPLLDRPPVNLEAASA